MAAFRARPIPSGRGTFARWVAAALLVAVLPGCSSGPERSVEGFCTAYVEVAEQAGTLGDPDDTAIPTLRAQVAEIDRAAAHAAERAPEEIADAVEAVIRPLHELRDHLEHADDRDEVVAALGGYAEATAAEADQQARLDRWATENCGVVPVTTTTTPATVAPGLTG